MNKHFLTLVAVLTLAAISIAGIRSEGKYCGVVIFDRWGGCTLYSGVYVMYISEDVKEQLRPEAGKCVQIDATKVEQPRNPGDGLIKQFKVLGPAPAAKAWESPEGLKLTVSGAFKEGSPPEVVIRIENVSDESRTLRMSALAPTVLAANDRTGKRWTPSDGPSVAVVTRQSFWVGMGGPRMRGSNDTWQWKVVAPQTLDERETLVPGAAFELRLALKLPAGEYEFLAGYGGGVHAGQCIASNRVGFEVKQDGSAVLAKAAGE